MFAIGMTYPAHAAEAGLGTPESDPVVFAKFPSSITGPAAVVELSSEAVDYAAESLSAIVPLLPGDLIFTGTPAGIGWARDPKVVLRAGDRLVTHAEAIGEMSTTFTTA